MNDEIISVIVAIYNVEKYLPRCLETIALQTYKNLEIILVDDGSNDNSGRICDDFASKDSRCTVIHKENHGLWSARNAGQSIAHGKYIKFVDGDDYLHVDSIRHMYEAINQNGGYDLVISESKSTYTLDEDIYEYIGDFQQTELTQDDLFRHLFEDEGEQKVLFHYAWNRLYRKELAEDIFTNDYIRAQDVDYNIRYYLKTKKAIWIHCKLCFYIQRDNSLMKHPDTALLDIPCLADIYFLNYKLMTPSEKAKYGHYLLKQLYFTMLLWKDKVWKTDNEDNVFWICKQYKNASIGDLWRNSKIGFNKKATYSVLIHHPWLTRKIIAFKGW